MESLRVKGGTMDTRHALKGLLLFGGIVATGIMVLMLYTSLKVPPPSKTIFQRAGERTRANDGLSG